MLLTVLTKTVVADATFTVKKADGTVDLRWNIRLLKPQHMHAISANADGALAVTPVKVTTTSGAALAVKQPDAGDIYCYR